MANLPDTDAEEAAAAVAETKEASAEMKAAAETDVAEAAANNKTMAVNVLTAIIFVTPTGFKPVTF